MNPSQNLAPNPDLAPTQDLILNQDLIPNQINDISIRICKAKEFLRKNSKEQSITAARIYDNLPESTLWSSITRPQTIKRGVQSQILQEHQKNAIHLSIQ